VKKELDRMRKELKSAAKSSLTVMTFNIRHAEGMDGKVSLERVLDVVRRAEPDIVALQEVDRNKYRSGFQDQIVDLAGSLAMNWCYAASLVKGISQYGNAVLSRYPIIANKTEVLPGPDGKERRTVLYVVVKLGTLRLHVYNTHLGVTDAERAEQCAGLRKLLERAPKPAILMGDFNMGSDAPLLQRAIPGGWTPICLEPSNSPTIIGGRAIDHLFVNFPSSKLTAHTLPTEASDHRPVVAQIPLNMIHW
jgi:endonuclease/exonuclease/phosphatase family metal-dependent hydrolase